MFFKNAYVGPMIEKKTNITYLIDQLFRETPTYAAVGIVMGIMLDPV